MLVQVEDGGPTVGLATEVDPPVLKPESEEPEPREAQVARGSLAGDVQVTMPGESGGKLSSLELSAMMNLAAAALIAGAVLKEVV